MIDYAPLATEWDALVARRSDLREPLAFWTAVLARWLQWKEDAPGPLRWSVEERVSCWERGTPLLIERPPSLPRTAVEELVGPIMERLALHVPDAAGAFQRFAESWDREEIGPEALLPRRGSEPAATLVEQFGLEGAVGAFLAPVALRPALEGYFQELRQVPEGVWTRGTCPWCGGFPSYGDLIEDGRRRLFCPLCGGMWIAPRLKCPFCESWDSRDLVRLVAEGNEEGYFIEACRSCRGYIKGVDRRQRWNAGSPQVEDWGSPHLDVYAAEHDYWRPTPCLAHLERR
jgi:hypothetical protein